MDLNILSVERHWNVAGYNYDLEICALVFLFLIIARFFYKKRFPTAMNMLFGLSLFCATIDIIVDIIASVFVNDYIYSVPIWINALFNGAFYILQVMFPCLMFLYVLILLGPKFYKNKKYYLFLIPCLIFTLVDITNPITHWVFYFGENEEGVLSYLHGKVFIAYYITAIFYFLLTAIFTIAHHKDIEKKQSLTIYTSLIIILGGIAIQMIFPEILLTGITITTALFLIEDNIANPDDMIDKISGVFNYNALTIYIDKVMEQKKNHHFILLNIESLTPINDTLGINIGNSLYRQIGSYLNSINKSIWTFRIFSSKFVLSFESESDAINAANNIYLRFQEPWHINSSDFIPSCSIIEFTDNGKIDSCESFLNYTSTLETDALKDKNRTIVYFDSKRIERINKEIQIERIITEALANDGKGFYMNYQPIYDVKENKYSSAEALLRFKCDELGVIPPNDFIPIAEKAGLASAIDEFVLNSVCKFLSEHNEIDTIDVNLSRAEFFADPSNKFIRIIDRYGIKPSRICFEITETATEMYPHHVDKFMKRLIEKGSKFAIDDFGTGYSNVSQLLNQPFSIIKLDKTLLIDENKTRHFLITMSSMFEKLNYPLVIEGVETRPELDFIKSIDIRYVQGFYFSRPLNEDDFLNFLKENNH